MTDPATASPRDRLCWTGESSSPAQTRAIGAAIARHALAGDILALVGELGAGKTQLVRGLAEGLNVEQGAVASPTFVVVHEYLPRNPGAGTPVLVHVDAYRLHSLEDLESIGWDFTGGEPGAEFRRDAVVAIEWADRLGAALGGEALEVRLEHRDETHRRMEVRAAGRWTQRWTGLLAELEKAASPAVAAAARGKCPICGKAVDANGAAAPFCSARCRTIDLGRWLGGTYTISRPLDQSDFEET